ncbi:MAG: hypothetical protein IKZ07_06400 [Akkermansia sp.]|nr:hypothetical protein [Akkermansia sp.]
MVSQEPQQAEPVPAGKSRAGVCLRARLCASVTGLWKNSSARDSGDMQWLRWAVLSVVVLLAVMLLMLSGCFEVLDEAQLRMLCGNPFYLEAEATQHPALSQAGMFGWCVGVTLYLGIVLLRQQRFSARTQIAVMAAVAVVMPGLLCVLGDCVFYVAPLLFCVLFTWALVVTVPFFRNSQS